MFDIIFAEAPEGFVEVGQPGGMRLVTPAQLIATKAWPQDHDLYYSPTLRRDGSGEKSSVIAGRVIWADVDLPDTQSLKTLAYRKPPKPIMPPSLIVYSGWGWHYYWVLDKWLDDVEMLETLNKLMGDDIDADHCWNANRILRVPGSVNHKHGSPLECRVIEASSITYSASELLAYKSLAKKTKHKVRTGESRGYPTRSERDFAVVRELLTAGLSQDLVRSIFQYHAVGDSYRDRGEGGAKYLERTMAAAAPEADRKAVETSELDEREDGYYIVKGRASRRVSTFVLNPTLLLQGEEQDAVQCDVRAGGFEWKSVTFTRTAFNGRPQMDKETRLASWQWLGRDDDVRILLPHLLAKLESIGFPHIRATSVLGLHVQSGASWFVGDKSTLGVDGPRGSSDAPLVYLETRREHAKLGFDGGATSLTEVEGASLHTIASLLPSLNAPASIWPTLGWYFATPFKPAIEACGFRFPILNIFGTKGSGKTTSILRVFLPLLGQLEPKTYDAMTTKFVILSLMGSSNAVPVAFSEFRQATANAFIRFILLSYDTGHDPRGRADQTTQDYPLSAPFSIDGEDAIDDPACKERMIAIDYHPDNVAEGSDAWIAYQRLRTLTASFQLFATFYLQYCLQMLNSKELALALSKAREVVLLAFPQGLPDRVRNNLSVCWFGISTFCTCWNVELPDPRVALTGVLNNVFSNQMGRVLTAADEFVTDLVNHLATHQGRIRWAPQEHEVWFQMTPAYNWWVQHKRRSGSPALGKDAIRAQLAEASYSLTPTVRDSVMMYGIDLVKAQAGGLDLPNLLDMRKITQEF